MELAKIGFVSHMKNKYFPVTKQCRTGAPPETQIRALQIKDLTVIFIILVIGLSLSVLAFIAELIFGHLLQ